jgi:hypothetical protein
MSTIRYNQKTTSTAEQFIAGLTDFGPVSDCFRLQTGEAESRYENVPCMHRKTPQKVQWGRPVGQNNWAPAVERTCGAREKNSVRCRLPPRPQPPDHSVSHRRFSRKARARELPARWIPSLANT